MIHKDLLKQYLIEYGIEQSDAVIDKLDCFAQLLVETNRYVNLTAITDPDEIVCKHFLDSLSIFHFVDFPKQAKIIDVGCGAGFPSLPILIARNDLDMYFMDSTGKKLHFIDTVLNELHLKGTTIHGRAEEKSKESVSRETFDYALARAVANLRSLAELTLPFVKIGGYFIAMKGKEGKEELEQAKNSIALLGGKTEQIHSFTLPDGGTRTIILIKKISHTPTRYPRASSAILKKPL